MKKTLNLLVMIYAIILFTVGGAILAITLIFPESANANDGDFRAIVISSFLIGISVLFIVTRSYVVRIIEWFIGKKQ